ncbi:Tyrosine-protein phosphatase non-receptor type 12 [Frankliniella fusca]|uniref:protein-tyrosine-phosphatase n=1 Tax=Frankliniella fusca TaxID=407009 RepID=A0AAE1LCA3_9NEOP|nr:Tyrosine-protein phosphatase non-receptor type 12 [Frankliniella fusca]
MKEDKGRTPLRIILNNFLNHIEKLESLRSPDDSYEKEFQDLKLFSENLKGQKQYSSAVGEKEINRKKNRYKDILPFDFSRVVLSEYVGTAGSDYINANFIRGASGSPAYIASQGPLAHTVNDFWRMVVECEVHVIIMACNEDEAGKHKCEKYWVDREGEVKQFGMVRIRLIQGSDVCPDFSVRTIKIEYTNKDSTTEERTVCQFHYSAWPDHGVPPSVRPLLDMVRLVRDTQASETLPVLVHCSAGCGRTGTICAIDYVWGLLRAGKLTKDFSLYTLVREMRRQRVAMVQTTEQYILVHRAVRELFKEQLRVIDSHPYENIDVDGVLIHSKSDEEPLYESVRTIEEPKTIVNKPIAVEDTLPAPPLPRKNRIHVAASKHEKEVENQTQKQRNNQGGPVGIAKLKAMFERSPVARSQSLGRRQASNPVPVVTPPCPALPIKRSKSLRIVGSGERHKLSVLAHQSSKIPSSNGSSKTNSHITKPKAVPGAILRRRRSFESESSPKPIRHSLHLDDDGRKLLQDCKDFLSRSVDYTGDVCQRTDGIVGGKGIRERRDSFRQAISKTAEHPTDKIPSNGNFSIHRNHASPKSSETTDEVDGPLMHHQYKSNTKYHDEVDASQSNVIVVKHDCSSPKVDLYVKGLTGETISTNFNHQNENGCDPFKQFGVIWNRAATSIDLKSNLRNNDMSLQELKSCLRREGTAHELKTRKNEGAQNVLPVKPYKSLDRVPKKDERMDILPTPPEWRPLPVNSSLGSPHRSPQTTVDRRNPLTVPNSPHRSPQTTVDRRNPLPNMPSPHNSPQATVDRRHPLHASSSPHRSPQTTFDRRNPLPSPHQSPQATVDRRNPLSSHTSPHSSPQTTVDRRNPLSAAASPHISPQTTVDRRNPVSSHSSPHNSPQTTVDRRNHFNQLSGALMSNEIAPTNARSLSGVTQHSPQTTVERRTSNSGPQISPQTTVDRRAPISVSSSPHISPQTTVDRRNVMLPNGSLSAPPPSNQPLAGSGQIMNSHISSSPSHPASLPINGHGLLRPMPVEHQNLARTSNSPQHRVNNTNPTQTTGKDPYSYGLVASVLRRGSQDDLALCVSGNSVISPKSAANSQHPSAPPRIKRHASVVLPRKNSGHKEIATSLNQSTPPVDPKRWAAKGTPNSTKKILGYHPGPLPPTVPLPSLQSAPSEPSGSKSATASTPSPSKSRLSPKKTAASSLSRALGALQLRRTGTSTSTTASTSSAVGPKGNTEETGLLAERSNSKTASPSKTTVPYHSAVPTMVINPGKAILPTGIIDDGNKKPLEHLGRSTTSMQVGSAHQTSYPPHSHIHVQPLAQPHPHSHPHPLSQPPPRPHSHLNSAPHHPPPQPYQHRHPYPPLRQTSPLQAYPHMSHQHPKTHKKQQYL